MPKRTSPDSKDDDVRSAKKAKQSKTGKGDGSGKSDGDANKPKKGKGGQLKAVNYSFVEEARSDLEKILRALEQAIDPKIGAHVAKARQLENWFVDFEASTEALDDGPTKVARASALEDSKELRASYKSLFRQRFPDEPEAYLAPVPVKKTADERMAALESQNNSIQANQAKILKRQKKLFRRLDQVVFILLQAKKGKDASDCVKDVEDVDVDHSSEDER